MSNVYQEKPNIVTVQITDDTGTAERFVVGKSLDEVIALIEPESPCAGPKPKKKDRKPRRTKAEMAKDRPETNLAGATATTTGVAEEKKETAWP